MVVVLMAASALFSMLMMVMMLTVVVLMAASTLFSMFMMVMLVFLMVMIMVVTTSALFSMLMMVMMMLVSLVVMLMVVMVMATSTLFSMFMMVMLVFLVVMIMVVVVMATSTLFSMFMVMMLMIVSFCCFTSAAGSLNNFYIWFHRLNCLSDFWQNHFRIFCCKSKLLGCKCNGYIAKLRQLTKLSLNLGCTVCTIKVLKNIYFSLHCDTSLFDIIELPQYMLKNNK